MPEYPQIVRVFFCDFFLGEEMGIRSEVTQRTLCPKLLYLSLSL